MVTLVGALFGVAVGLPPRTAGASICTTPATSGNAACDACLGGTPSCCAAAMACVGDFLCPSCAANVKNAPPACQTNKPFLEYAQCLDVTCSAVCASVGSGGSPGSCAPQTGSPSCDACASQKCCDAYQTCENSSACAEEVSCIVADCPTNQPGCISSCQVPGAAAAVSALSSCLMTSCGPACTASPLVPTQSGAGGKGGAGGAAGGGGGAGGHGVPTKMCGVGSAALHFDGTGAGFFVPPVISDDFTIEAWIRTAAQGPSGTDFFSGDGIVFADVPTVTDDFGTSLLDGHFAFGVGNPDVTVVSSTPVATGNWVHVAAIRNRESGSISVTINGVLDSSRMVKNLQSLNAPQRIAIGSDLNETGLFFQGDIDEVRLWSVARTAAQIQATMGVPLTGNEPGLVGYWALHEGSGNVVHDGSPSKHDASLSNGFTPPSWTTDCATSVTTGAGGDGLQGGGGFGFQGGGGQTPISSFGGAAGHPDSQGAGGALDPQNVSLLCSVRPSSARSVAGFALLVVAAAASLRRRRGRR